MEMVLFQEEAPRANEKAGGLFCGSSGAPGLTSKASCGQLGQPWLLMIDVPLEARLQSEYLEPLFFATYLAVAEKLRALVAEFKQAPFPEGVGASND